MVAADINRQKYHFIQAVTGFSLGSARPCAVPSGPALGCKDPRR